MKISHSNRYKQWAEHAISLLVVLLLLTATAVWTGHLFGHPIGESSKDEPTSGSSNTTLPTAATLEALGIDKQAQLAPRDSASWIVNAADNTTQGVIISSEPYAKDVKGFAGPTPLYIYVANNGIIQNIVAADNAETPDFFARAFNTLAPQWKGKSLSEATELEVDGVSGATFSSNALIANVQRSLAAQLSAQAHHLAEPTIGWGRTVVVVCVLALGIIISLCFKGKKWLRLLQLTLNVAVLGFWCGQFLSLSLLRGWLAYGLDVVGYLPTLLVLAVALIMPFFKRKHHYCSWVCPLGSMQELVGQLPFPKIHCSPKVYKAMSRIRIVFFALLLLVLWLGIGAEWLDYEPFTMFFFNNAAPAVIILAAVILVASCFMPNVWCKCLCPMGMALDLSENTQSK